MSVFWCKYAAQVVGLALQSEAVTIDIGCYSLSSFPLL